MVLILHFIGAGGKTDYNEYASSTNNVKQILGLQLVWVQDQEGAGDWCSASYSNRQGSNSVFSTITSVSGGGGAYFLN